MKMIKQLSRAILIVASGLAITATQVSCSKDDPAPAKKNIAEIVAGDANFSLLKQAIDRAGIGSALTSGTLTVFAPDNAAFAASGLDAADIAAISPADLAELLTYHVVSGARIASSGVPASDSVNTLNGENIYASKNANGVFMNGSKVKTADVDAANGVIHVISSVLIPPTETIAGLATSNADLSLLVAAVSRAGLVGAISSPGKYTVFAPTNAAFAAAGFPTEASINAAPVDAVAAIVKAHVLPTSVFASDLINGNTATTLQTGVTLTIGTTPPSVKITGTANPASNVVLPSGANIVATNGVVHVIDRVLLP